MAVQSPPYVLAAGSHSAALFRQAAFSTLLPRSGVVAAADFAVSAQATPNMSVQVAPGRTWMQGSQAANVTGGQFSTQAAYFGINDAAVTLTIAAANATNPRIDIVCAAVQDAAYSGSTNVMTLTVTTGTPAASPVAPAAPANGFVLAQVRVNANVTSITNSAIGNVAWRSSALNSVIPVGSQLERDFLPSITQGLLVYRQDTNHIEGYDGSAWQTIYTPTPPASFLQCAAQITGNTATQSTLNNTWTVANLGTNWFTPVGTLTSDGATKVVIGTAGKYLCTGAFAFSGNSATVGRRQGAIRKNGNDPGIWTGVTASTVEPIQALPGITFDCAVGDYIQVYVRQESGGTLNFVPNATVLSVSRVG